MLFIYIDSLEVRNSTTPMDFSYFTNNSLRRESTPAVLSSDEKGSGTSNNLIKPEQSSMKRRTSMFNPIDPMELQKTLYQNQTIVSI